MSRTRRYFEPDDGATHRGPSDEMLAVDAATELRSLTLLYERYSDRIYRYFLLCTADPQSAERLTRELIYRLPEELQRFGGQDTSFAGWLFARASEVYWQEFSVPSRVYRKIARFIPSRSKAAVDENQAPSAQEHLLADFAEIASALRLLPPDNREVLGIHFGAALRTAPAAEALKLPASLISSHVQRALNSLGEQLEVTNTRLLSEDLSDVMSQQSPSTEQRRNHFTLIHGLFHGEVEVEDDEAERKPVMEIAALIGVVLIGLIGIWVWSLLTPGDPQDQELESLPIAADAPDAPEATATATPEAEPTPDSAVAEAPAVTPEPSPEESDMAFANGVCLAADGKAQFDRFVSRYNAGDFDALATMLPDDAYDNPLSESSPETETRVGASFVHDGTSLVGQGSVTEFLSDRHSAGERWNVLEAYPAEHYRNWQEAAPLEMYEDWKREHPGLSMIIVAGLDWSSEAAGPEIARGRVIVDCGEELVISWDIQQYDAPGQHAIGLEDYLAAMQPLENGEIRQVSAFVQTDERPDGGSLPAWRVVWSQAADSSGNMLERVVVTSLDGVEIISFVSDQQRWRLNQRGWVGYGAADEPRLPAEIEQALPWLRQLAGIIEERDVQTGPGIATTLVEDFSFTAGGATERFLEVEITNGNLGAIRLRERTPNGERVRPEIRILAVTRETDFDLDQFQVGTEEDFPQLNPEKAHYDVPHRELDQLELLAMNVDRDQFSESYRISWNDVELELTVRPSRGGLDINSIPEGVDEAWTTAVSEYRFGTLVWVHRQFSGYPTDAIWDDGRYRFEIAVDRDAMSTEHEWNLRELIALADSLSVDLDASFEPGTLRSSGSAISRAGR